MLTAILGLSVGLLGQTEALSLSLALEKAMANNYGIILSKASASIAGINNDWGNAGRYPTVSFKASENNSYELLNRRYSGHLQGKLGLNWTLFNGLQVNITRDKLENLATLSEGQLAVMIENTVEDVILAYYNVRLQQEQLRVLKTVMELSGDRYNYELKKKELGGSVSYDVLQAQNVYLKDKASWMNQEVAVRNAIRNLNYLMGEGPEKTWVFEEAFEAEAGSYTMSDLLERMKSSNQTLQNQYTRLMLAENETELRKANYLPKLSLGAGIDANRSWSGTEIKGISGSNSLSPYGNLSLSYNIYSAGSRKRAVEIARIQEENTRVEIKQMEHVLRNELYKLFDSYSVRIALLEVAEEGLEAAELNMRISENKYKSGVINSFNYRDVQLIYLDASFSRLQAIYNLISNKAALTRITGGFLGEIAVD